MGLKSARWLYCDAMVVPMLKLSSGGERERGRKGEEVEVDREIDFSVMIYCWFIAMICSDVIELYWW